MADKILLDGPGFSLTQLLAIAHGAGVAVGNIEAMAASNAKLQAEIASGTKIYGVTTGLGPKVVQSLSESEISAFSLATIRGRAHAIGEPLPRDVVRAAMAIRLNGLLTGASGASPEIARHLAVCLNTDLIPHIGEITSTGPADLMWGGSFALALIGEGRFLGHDASSASVMAEAGIAPPALGPRDGLALVSHSSFTAALAGLGLGQLQQLLNWAQMAAALSLEGFQANLSPFLPGVQSLRVQQGAERAAADILTRLEGSVLFEKGSARRLQDPLSLRNIAQIHGSLFAALDVAEDCVTTEINGASDSPAYVGDENAFRSTGNFLNPAISAFLVAVGHASAQVAAAISARIARLLSERFTDLPNGLNDAAAGNAGLGPITKVSEALFAEIARAATPPPVYPSSSADSVEYVINYAAIAGRALSEINDRFAHMIAVELIVATQAVELRDQPTEAPQIQHVIQTVRQFSPHLTEDRPLGPEIEALADHIRTASPEI